jgi:hypothetical protein
MEVNGPVDAQFNRVFGPEYANVPGNVIIGAQGQNITPASRMPTPAQLSAAQSGGKRKKSVGGREIQDSPGVNPYLPPRARLASPQQNVWQTLAQSPNPEMAYSTGMGGKRKKYAGGTRGIKSSTQPLIDLAEALNQPVFPFAGITKQTYRRKRGGKRHTRRHRKH